MLLSHPLLGQFSSQATRESRIQHLYIVSFFHAWLSLNGFSFFKFECLYSFSLILESVHNQSIYFVYGSVVSTFLFLVILNFVAVILPSTPPF